MAEHRSRAERAFDRHLAKGRYPDGKPCTEADRYGFVRGWNYAHRIFAINKANAKARRQQAIDRANAAQETEDVREQ